MLWYKSWIETRLRFFIGLALAVCSAAATVFTYPRIAELLAAVPPSGGGLLGERIREVAEIEKTFGGFVWSNLFAQNLSHLVILFAAILGTAGIVSEPSGDLFTLSLPVSRHRLIAARAATGLAELFVIALVPSILIPILAPAIGQSYGVANAIAHGISAFIGVSVFYCLALLLSTVFGDPWRPSLIAVVAAIAVFVIDPLLRVQFISIPSVISGETIFRSRSLPWPGMIISAALAAALCWSAASIFARRDF